jgi:hypothetical protein
MEKKDKITANPVLKSYFSKIDTGLTAKASAYATVCKEITQRDLVESYRENPPDFLADDSILSITEPVYKATIKAFSSKKELRKWLAGISVWKFNASILNKVSSDQRENESKKLVEMYSNLDALTFSRIMDARSDEKRSKVDIVYGILQVAFDKMKNSPTKMSHE